MNLDNNTTQIIIAIITLFAAILGGTLISKKVIQKKSSKNKISKVNIFGNNSKIVGGDDNSVHK